MSNQTYARNKAWARAVLATEKNWVALDEHLEPDDQQLVVGLAQECFNQGYEAGYERRCQERAEALK